MNQESLSDTNIIYIDRPPRIQPELPFDEIEIPKPPEKDESGFERLIQMSLPLLTIIGYVAVTVLARAGRSPWLLIPMAMTVVASTIFAIYSYFRDKKRREELERAYTERLVELNKEMSENHDMQRRFYRYNYPDRETLFRIVRNARDEYEKGDRTLRAETRLWERRTTDDDFGVIRLGMGTLPSTVLYVLGPIENFDDPQIRDAMKLEEDSKYVDEIPVIISLRQIHQEQGGERTDDEDPNAGRTPCIHALGIAGERDSVYDFVRAVLAHFTVFQSPSDARLFILADRKREWLWTDNLPHCQDDEQHKYRFFLEESDGQHKKKVSKLHSDGDDLERYLEGIRKILAQRRIQLQEREENESKGDPTLPFLLIVADLMDSTYDDDSRLHDLESDAAISILLDDGAAIGAAVIFLLPERSKVPSGCQAVVETEKTTPASNRRSPQYQKLHFRYSEVGVNTYRYLGEADFIIEPSRMEELAEATATLRVRRSYGAGLTATVPFLELMDYASLGDLRVDSLHNWQASTDPQNAAWLQVRIGRMSGNKPRSLIFSAKQDGVHGMVAGSTGSGKSELLVSLITGLAVTYDPTVINFVLVDYKGGGAFNEFERLPHCVDIITNLMGNSVTRMFTAIQSELQRRQSLNAETGTKNIVEYRQRGLHQTHSPYPFLFIIIDEFAEMIADRAEYKSELETITRVGRAQGVTLILAAQRPSGVTDQMRSNIKFRICLRVETPAESREMLRRTDAAYLPGGIPGRGFLQVGSDEIEAIQVAYTGEKYVEPGEELVRSIIWPDRGDVYDESQDVEPPELYKAIIKLLNSSALDEGINPQRAPWPDFLPTQLALSEPLVASEATTQAITAIEYLTDIETILFGKKNGNLLTLNPSLNRWLNSENGWITDLDWQNYALRPVVGLVDNPYAAKQLPLTINLQRGHAVLFGASGWGKTTFIRTMAISLMCTHPPTAVQIYILDLGGRNLGALASFPHVGAVIIPDEEAYKERVEQLLRELDEIVEARKVLLSTFGFSDIYEYNAAHPDDAITAVVVAIDNFVEFSETFGVQKDNVESVLDRFVTLVRQSKPYGIHFVITANRLNILSSQLYSLFNERITLKLTDPMEYRAVVGGQVADIPDIPGRGYVKIGRLPLSFQMAIPLDLTASGVGLVTNEIEEFERLACSMQEHADILGAKFKPLFRIDALPKSVLFKQILAREFGLEPGPEFTTHLAELTQQKWSESTLPEHTDWLQTTIAIGTGNRLRSLQFEAKKDGVHGLVAGGTGSGKSELLMTLIVDLAIRYDPSILNFVLVDYKGGGAFGPFEKLPHCVDIITNLNKAAVRRMFTAINAEMQRRQALNTDTGTKDIIEYRAKGLHLKRAPYPHLFIIIDEYAEMIADSPDFKDELDSITRVGRAQGINLLLAAQRPIGVTDQMRANIKYRMCLRVEGVDTSREMLRRSDAAYLPNGVPGRGFLQVGNENIELLQVAYTGEPYEYASLEPEEEQPKFYDVVVDLADKLSEGKHPSTPWPPFLPEALTFSDELSPAYLPEAFRPLVTLNQVEDLALNPFLQEWLEGTGRWYGMDWGKTAMRAIVGLIDDPYNARQLPLTIDFMRGHAIVFGASGWGKSTLLRSLVLSLAATHSPDELHVHVLDLGGRNLEVLSALPHVGTVIMPDERGYEERVQQLLRELAEIVDNRKQRFSEMGVSTLTEYNELPEVTTEHAVLVVLDNFAEFIETFGDGQQKENDDSVMTRLVLLVRQAKAFGVHFIVAANRLNVLSNKLFSLFTERLTLRLSNPDDYRTIVGGRTEEIEEIAGRGYVKLERLPLQFQIALPPGTVDENMKIRGEIPQIREIGRMMSTHIAQGSVAYREPLRIDALPKTSSYRQVLAEKLELDFSPTFLPQLKSAMQARWDENADPEQADWLKVDLGITSGNRIRTIEFEAKKDGVHGMIAGGTGSGKSEMLMTLIVGLAINYSPDILNFVLVDYKGGGAFRPFEKLPHCVDIVTNLNQAAVNRMFTAINAEIRRRQQLNADTGTKDIVDYRRKGLHLTGDSYPHLFIIIDEYAEMIDDNPEYKSELESITRVGRAQGINLILASQRPKGVTDQMRANIKLRLCLRVEEIDTSREMLRRPDAAFLPNGLPGRGYLQIGNENLELVQVSWTGETQPTEVEESILWPDRPLIAGGLDSEDTPKFYDAVVSLASELVENRMAPKPWPGFLPNHFSLQSQLYDAQKRITFTLTSAVTDWVNGETSWPGIEWRNDAMNPVVGLLDEPSEASQTPLHFDLKRNHLVIFGDAGWGKTSLLRTIILNLASTHSPSEFHVYILDLSGRNFVSMETLPHVGAVVYSSDENYEERLQRLLGKLSRMADERQQILGETDAENVFALNRSYPEKAFPAVLVAIDNFAELQENYEMLVQNILVPLVRRSLRVGISFIFTGNTPSNIPGKLYSLLGERITFKQTNPDRYMDIVGRGALEIDDIPGRGYIRIRRRPLMFQAALPLGIPQAADGSDSRTEGEELRLLNHRMDDVIQSGSFFWKSKPDTIETLPELLGLRELIRTAGEPSKTRIEALLGLNDQLLPAHINLKRMGPHFAVVGPPLSGKTTVLYSWVLSMSYRHSPDEAVFVLVDTQHRFIDFGGQRRLDELPHVIASVFEIEELEALMPILKSECELLASGESSREIYVIIDNFDDFVAELEENQEFRELNKTFSGMARRFGRDGLHIIIGGTLDSGISELRRRVQASNYGIALQSESAVQTLKVKKMPPGLRDKELPAGRGYIVKAGHPTLIQLATPTEGMGIVSASPNLEDEEERMIQALDVWIKRISKKHAAQKAEWHAGAAEPETPVTGDKPEDNPRLRRILTLLQRGFHSELERLEDGDEIDELVTAKFVRMDRVHWDREDILMDLLKEIWIAEKQAEGFPRDMSELVLETLQGSDSESILNHFEETFPDDDTESND